MTAPMRFFSQDNRDDEEKKDSKPTGFEKFLKKTREG
jgi:hypothetical protein